MNGGWPHGDPRAVVHAILAEAPYRAAAHTAAPKSFWDVVGDAVRTWWRNLTRPLAHVLGNDAVTNVVGIVVLVAALVFLGFVVARFARPYLRAARGRAAAAAASALRHDDGARGLRERAAAAIAAGRYHEAAALLWASALRALDEAGRVRYDAARTPGEWRRAVRDPAFDALARDAVVALFGDRDVDAVLVARMRAAYDAVVARA